MPRLAYSMPAMPSDAHSKRSHCKNPGRLGIPENIRPFFPVVKAAAVGLLSVTRFRTGQADDGDADAVFHPGRRRASARRDKLVNVIPAGRSWRYSQA